MTINFATKPHRDVQSMFREGDGATKQGKRRDRQVRSLKNKLSAYRNRDLNNIEGGDYDEFDA